MLRAPAPTPRRNLRLALAALAVALLALVLAACATGAGTGTEAAKAPDPELVGSGCEAVGSGPGGTVIQNEIASRGYLARSPVDGVVTQWTVKLAYEPPQPLSVAVAAVDPLGSNQFRIRALSAPVQVKQGTNVFPSRLHIIKGGAIALSSVGEGPIPHCETADPTLGSVWSAGRPAQVGETLEYTLGDGEVPVAARVEADVDLDGYGDETQDRCPRSGAIHAKPCPRVKVSLGSLTVRGDSVRAVATTSAPAPVSIKALVSVPGRKRPLGIQGPLHRVEPGHPGHFTLDFSRRLEQLLAALPSSRSATMVLTATAIDLAGAVTTATARAKLPGRG